MRKITTHTPESLKAMTVECGDCWEWQRYFANGTPYVSHNGKMTSVRKLFSSLIGRYYEENGFIIPKCENNRCINPEHFKNQNRTQMSKRNAKRATQSLQKRIKIQKFKQETLGKLSWDKVDEIRSSDVSARELARKFNVHHTIISRVRRNESWIRLQQNPFQGLIR